MATGTSACLYLRKISQPHLLARNESRLGIVGLGLRQMRLRQSTGRTIHTTRGATVPLRPSLRPRPAGARVITRHNTHDHGVDGGFVGSGLLMGFGDEVSRKAVLEANIGRGDNEVDDSLPAENDAVNQENDFDDVFNRLVKTDLVSETVKVVDLRHKRHLQNYICTVDLNGKRKTLRRTYPTYSPSEALAQGRKFVVGRLQKTGLWEKLEGLLSMLESGDEGFSRSLKQVNAFAQSQLPSSVVSLRVQDDLMCVLDEEAMNDLDLANTRARDLIDLRKKNSREHSNLIQPISRKARRHRNQQLEASKFRANTSNDPSYRALRHKVRQLPVRQRGKEVVNLINSNAFSLCVAETGSGKSTQVPQLLLEDAISRSEGAYCKILCVQPRRVAARGLSLRVAHERHEYIGNSVGYSVRFDSKPPKNSGSIQFCTTGILMNMLKDGPETFASFSHIVLDEVHTRDVQLDLAVMVLRRMIEQRMSRGESVPKVVLMSATVDVELFASYFTIKAPDGTALPVPHIEIPGRSFEIKKHYLEEVVHGVSHTLRPEILTILLQEHGPTANFLNNHFKALDQPEESGVFFPSESPSELEESNVATGLITAHILSILSQDKEGSILAFAPGMKHLEEISSQLQAVGPRLGLNFDDTDRFKIIILHSQLHQVQNELLAPVPEGCQRIIISTDIAESSLTIPDVRHVIDSGKNNRADYDSGEQVHEIAPRWISKASALQRAGRAGRTQNGNYYFLGSSKRFHALNQTNSSELTRSTLELLCLNLRRIMPDPSVSLSELFAQTLEPPEAGKVRLAVEQLQNLRALDDKEELTSLGRILEQLAMDPASGKMVLLGLIFRCLDPMLVLASLGSESLFHQQFDANQRARANATRVRLQGKNQARSDHILNILAYNDIRTTYQENEQRLLEERDSSPVGADRMTRAEVDEEAAQLTAEYAHADMLKWGKARAAYMNAVSIMRMLNEARLSAFRKPRMFGEFGYPDQNRNSDNQSLIKALLVHCLSPNLAVKYVGTNNLEINPGVRLAQSIKSTENQTTLFAYTRKVARKSFVEIQEVTEVSPLSACLLAQKLEPKDGNILVDSWLEFALKGESADQEDIVESLILFHEKLNATLQTAFEVLGYDPVSHTKLGSQWNRRRQKLFTELETAVEAIVSLETPQERTVAPQHWTDST
ncbi:uncharacterized protein N7506_001555 [Penicillium brevicompactum]|uniref:uncharacterized protein n=1 Tax=Penicillium brevicompactum TaxID=5074 RepID=UPI002540B9FB|nr:uncharacterized protein N7506_001555 [Penicillium brevicompactum]KAJ5348302.1 hypothetical protein N7506_001555 [Penicillium brevicompactum]